MSDQKVSDRLASHPWLIGDPDLDGAVLAHRVRFLTLLVILVANVIGAAVVAGFSVWALPKPAGGAASDALPVNLAAGSVYLVVAIGIGVFWGRRLLEGGEDGIASWLESGQEPTPAQRRSAIRGPLRIMLVQVVLWSVAAILFAIIDSFYSGLLALGVGMTIALGGITTSAAAYLSAELALRPVVARALTAGPTEREGVPGVATRWLLAWALGTGAPLIGLVVVGIVGLTDVPIDADTLAVTMVVLGSISIVFGALVSGLAAYATVHPIGSIRRGLDRIGDGDFSATVPIWDSTEMGLLQSGFNEMATGLRDRERIRDIFGRQVGRDVAEQVLETDDPELGGETATVAVLFVDIIGSTELASTQDPQEVVGLLNRFFAEVVSEVERHGGWINKFEGDAALAIFGAPTPLPERDAAALAAARSLDSALRERVPEAPAGIGVASGSVVAGHIGAESRFEYTVIGDPVNEAARLTELAKDHSGRVLASADTLDEAGDEATQWTLGDSVQLRGRAEETRLAIPNEGGLESPA